MTKPTGTPWRMSNRMGERTLREEAAMGSRKSAQAKGANPIPDGVPARGHGAKPIALSRAATASAQTTRPGARREPVLLFPARQDAAVTATATAHKPKRQRFGDLREALADGWEIVQPIFARPLWSALDDSKTAFNFVLARPHGRHGMRLVTVPQGPTVEKFIRARQLTVDYAR